jgi:hypothetical protein
VTATDRDGVIARVLRWLELGYPDGIPRQDRFPLIALLERRLTEDQAHQVVAQITSPDAQLARGEDPITPGEIETLIQRQVREVPSSQDVTRVSARLAAGGWPLATPDED